jgi:hypothetical protein
MFPRSAGLVKLETKMPPKVAWLESPMLTSPKLDEAANAKDGVAVSITKIATKYIEIL